MTKRNIPSVRRRRNLEDVKNKFISNLTHELRTPVVAIQKSIDVLKDEGAGPLNETQKNFLNIVSRNLGYLSHLVEDLLDVAKIQAGKMVIKPAPGRLEKVIRDVCELLETWARSKNVRLTSELQDGFPDVSFDPEKITQVLNNLIGNAVKFTSSGGEICVKGRLRPDGKRVEVSVSDTGQGIAAADLKKLFGRFQQFGDLQGISGTGLGLSISKEIVKKHGGEIFAESKLQKGSTFTFTLPVKTNKNK